jgi:hypothetical protein
MTKKVELVNLEEALAKVPEADRDMLREEIKALFADGMPEGAKPVFRLAAGEKSCPNCGSELVYAGPPGRAVILDGEPMRILECEPCDMVFDMPAPS